MKRQVFQRRFPTYLGGFLLGLAAVFFIMRMKKAMMPEFHDVVDKRPRAEMVAGGFLRLQLGPEPGKLLAYGFPTQLMVGRKGENGLFTPVIRMEYRDLVEAETKIGPIPDAGEFELRAQFFTCAVPGEAHCARIQLEQPIFAFSGREAASEVPVVVDLKGVAEKAAAQGKAAESSTK